MAPNTMNERVDLDFLDKYPIGRPIDALDRDDVRLLFRAAYDWLAHHYEQVNRLNVFPVPDGDTGTNMLLTLKAAWASIVERAPDTAGGVFVAAAAGAHHGSRGNSGVILGQLLRGMADALAGEETVSALSLAEALRRGSESAYAGVPEPVEGTILTVARQSSAAASASSTDDVRTLLGEVVLAADEAVARTPDLLPILKKAGVVDSGGKGLYYVFEGMSRALTGRLQIENGDAHLGDVVEEVVDHALRKGMRELPSVTWGFDVQFLVEKPNKTVAEILADISAMGDCPLVEGDADLVKVHVHVFDPGDALSYGVRTGFVTDVVVENMDDMAAMAKMNSRDHDANRVGRLSLKDELPADDEIGVIAVSPGDGFTDIFHGLGVHAVVRGGQTMNPSTAQIVEAIDTLPCHRLVILPNNGNIIMAAEQAATLAGDPRHDASHGKQVIVVPTKTAPQGIGAMLAYGDSAADLGDLAEAMTEEASQIKTGEVTQAVRAGDFGGVNIDVGDIIGLVDGKLVLRDETVDRAVLNLLTGLIDDDVEIVTFYRGEETTERAAENLAEQVRNVYPELDVELAYGGQPHYDYILSVE